MQGSLITLVTGQLPSGQVSSNAAVRNRITHGQLPTARLYKVAAVADRRSLLGAQRSPRRRSGHPGCRFARLRSGAPPRTRQHLVLPAAPRPLLTTRAAPHRKRPCHQPVDQRRGRGSGPTGLGRLIREPLAIDVARHPRWPSLPGRSPRWLRGGLAGRAPGDRADERPLGIDRCALAVVSDL
jgi:hypothetical protein